MRILLIANIYPYETGGAEVQARHLAENWIQKNHKITIAGNRIPSKKIKIQEHNGQYIECININTIKINRFMRAASYTLSLFWLLLHRRKEFDVIYCRFIQDAAIVISLFKKIRLLNIPFFVCAECSGGGGDATALKKLPYSNTIIKLIDKECSAVNALSFKIEQELISIGFNKNKFCYIPNGIKKIEVGNNERGFNDPIKIIFIGRLCEQKGIAYLFKAIAELNKKEIAIELTVVGNGPLMQDLKELSYLIQIANIVNFTGRVDQETVFSLLTEHDIFVLPSLFEGFGIVAIEAMAMGLPVVVTRCGGPEDFVDNSVGRIAEAGNAASLAQALQELLELSPEELHAMGMAAREKVRNNFDINMVADQYIQLFKQHI